MHAAVLITPPAELPAEIADLKAHSRILHSVEDAILGTYLRAAIGHLDGPRGVLGRCLVTQTWRQDFDGWADVFRLPVPDVQSVAVRYIDSEGQTQTVDSANYRFDNQVEAAFLHLDSDFTRPELGLETRGVQIELTAGFGGAADVPPQLVAAILILAGHLYAHRELVSVGKTVAMMPMSFDALIAPWRRGLV